VAVVMVVTQRAALHTTKQQHRANQTQPMQMKTLDIHIHVIGKNKIAINSDVVLVCLLYKCV
jgi:hypothetical protein